MNTFNRLLFHISLQMAVFSGISAVQQPVEQKNAVLGEKTVQKQVPAFDMGQFLNDQSGSAAQNPADEQRLIEQAFQNTRLQTSQINEQRKQARIKHLFEDLPEETKKSVQNARLRYQSVIALCNLGDCLVAVNRKLNAVLKENASIYQGIVGAQKYDAIVSGIEGLLISLKDGSINALLPETKTGGFVMPLVKPMQEKGQVGPLVDRTFSINMAKVTQLRLLFMEVWGKLGQGITDKKILAIRQEFYFLTLVLYAVEKQNPYALIKQCVAHLRPDLAIATGSLNDAIKRLEQHVKKAEADKNRLLRSALRQWIDELKRYARALEVFDSVDKRMQAGSLSPEKFQELFSLVGYVYTYLGRDFLHLWANDPRNEHATRSWIVGHVFDWAFSGALAAWFFSQHQADFLTSFIQMTLTNTKEENLAQVGQSADHASLGKMNIAQNMMGGLMMSDPSSLSWQTAASQALPIALFGPGVFNVALPKSAELGSKVFTSWVYYNCFHNNLFRGDALWDPTDAGIKNAMKDVFNEGKNTILNLIKIKLKYSHPAFVKNLEEKTLGIVRPEMLTTFLDACWPALVANTVGGRNSLLASLTRKDYYDGWFQDHYSQAELNQAGVTSCDYDWIKWKMSEYVATSVGEHVGRKLSYSERVRGFFWDCFQGMAARGWISNDVAAMSDEFELGIDGMLDQIRMIFLDPRVREPLVWQFKNLRIIDYYEQDNKRINVQLLQKSLGMLEGKGLLSSTDVVELLKMYIGNRTKKNVQDQILTLQERSVRDYEEEVERIDTTLARFKEIVKDKFSGMIGSWIGSWVGGKIAQGTWMYYHPGNPGSPMWREGIVNRLNGLAKPSQEGARAQNLQNGLTDYRFNEGAAEIRAIGDVFA